MIKILFIFPPQGIVLTKTGLKDKTILPNKPFWKIRILTEQIQKNIFIKVQFLDLVGIVISATPSFLFR
tara:strand:+ start:502 stop:708 length:207 start_codon:yes stop_codon:yes gene_type:complete